MGLLRALLRITRPSPQDIEMLAACLERGSVWERELAIDILLEHAELDQPALTAAALRAVGDPDAVVREKARTLTTTRGW